MKIESTRGWMRNDFWATYICEHCGAKMDRYGYDDENFYKIVIPGWYCKECGLNRAGEAEPTTESEDQDVDRETQDILEWLDKYPTTRSIYERSWRMDGGTEWSGEGVEELARNLYLGLEQDSARAGFDIEKLDSVNWRLIAETWNTENESEG